MRDFLFSICFLVLSLPSLVFSQSLQGEGVLGLWNRETGRSSVIHCRNNATVDGKFLLEVKDRNGEILLENNFALLGLGESSLVLDDLGFAENRGSFEVLGSNQKSSTEGVFCSVLVSSYADSASSYTIPPLKTFYGEYKGIVGDVDSLNAEPVLVSELTIFNKDDSNLSADIFIFNEESPGRRGALLQTFSINSLRPGARLDLQVDKSEIEGRAILIVEPKNLNQPYVVHLVSKAEDGSSSSIAMSQEEESGFISLATGSALLNSSLESEKLELSVLELAGGYEVSRFSLLTEGSTVKISSSKDLTLIAETKSSSVARVDFDFDGVSPYRREYKAPFAIAGDSGGFYRWNLTAGDHSVRVRAYSDFAGNNLISDTGIVRFRAVDGSTPSTTTVTTTTSTTPSTSSTTTTQIASTTTTKIVPPSTTTTKIVPTTTSTTTSSSTTTTQPPTPGSAVLRVDPNDSRWFSRSDGKPFFMSGAGDPEDFFYRGSRNADGTRNGDQSLIIQKLKASGANAIYIQAIRSHGGDGDATHNPFVGNNSSAGLNSAVLDQWYSWLKELDDAGIVSYFFIYDDESVVWSTGDTVSAQERSTVEGIVNRFDDLGNIVWVVMEEYDERLSSQRISSLAQIIKSADDNHHPVAIHKTTGLAFGEFADDSNLDSFAVQFNSSNPSELNSAMVSAFNTASGRYNVTLAESSGHLSGSRDYRRRQSWAIAMANSYVLHYGTDVANTPEAELKDIGDIRRFFEATTFKTMAPNNSRAAAQTDYVLAGPRDYILYADSSSTPNTMGVNSLASGTYRLSWYDIDNDNYVVENKSHGGGTGNFSVPAGFGNQVAVFVDRL